MASSGRVNAPLWKNVGWSDTFRRISADPSKITLPLPAPNSDAIRGTPITCILKSLNIPLDLPATAWQVTHPPLPGKMRAPFFSVTLTGGVGENKGEFRFSDGAPGIPDRLCPPSR
jgi:hypothetical protein